MQLLLYVFRSLFPHGINFPCNIKIYCGLTQQAPQYHSHLFTCLQWYEERSRKRQNSLFKKRQFNGTEKEGKIILLIKEYTNQMMHSAVTYQPLTNAKPVPAQEQPSWSAFPDIITEHDTTQYQIVGQFVCLTSVPSQSNVHLQSLYQICIRKMKSSSLSVSSAPKQLKHQCFINIILILSKYRGNGMLIVAFLALFMYYLQTLF